MKVGIKRLGHAQDLPLPHYATAGSAGLASLHHSSFGGGHERTGMQSMTLFADRSWFACPDFRKP